MVVKILGDPIVLFSGIIFWRDQPASQPPGPLSFKANLISNHWYYLSQTSNLSLGYWTKIIICFKLRPPPLESDLKLCKWDISASTGQIFSNFKCSMRWPKYTNDSNDLQSNIFKLRLRWPKQSFQILQMKTTS